MIENELQGQTSVFSVGWLGERLLLGRKHDVAAVTADNEVTSLAPLKPGGALQLSVARSGAFFLAGSRNSVVRFNATGKVLQKSSVRGEVHSLTLSPDDARFAAFADDEAGSGKVVEVGKDKAVLALSKRYALTAWIDETSFVVVEVPFRGASFHRCDLAGAEVNLGTGPQVCALAAFRGRVFAAVNSGVVEVDLAAPTSKKARLKQIFEGPAAGLIATDDGLLVATAEGVFNLPLGGKAVRLTRTPASKVAWRKDAIAFTQDGENERGDWASRVFVLRK